MEVQFSIDSPSVDLYPLVSYAIDGKSNELSLAIDSDASLVFYINNQEIHTSVFFPELLNGDKHTVSVSWDSLHGHLVFYVNGVIVAGAYGFETGYVLQSGGELVLGQDQDSTLGGFDAEQMISGTYYDLRLWNEVRSEAEIAGNHQHKLYPCLLYTSPSPRDKRQSRMPSSA